jgi:hypothetical protein
MNALRSPMLSWFRVAALAVFSIALHGPSLSQDSLWTPPQPAPGALVWIKLPSGEWLGGHIESLRDEDFVFDSEELDEQEFDWDDIIELHSAQVLTLGFDVYGTVTGTVTMKNGIISVRNGDVVNVYPKSMLLSIIEGTPTEWNYWSLKANIGFVARAGNTDQTDLNTYLFIRRETPRTRFDFNHAGNFGKVQDQLTISNRNVSAKFDWLVASGFFVTPMNITMFNDRFQNIDLRMTVSAGVGYFITRTGKIEWSVEMGGGYQKTTYHSVLAGEEAGQSVAIVNPATSLHLDVTKAFELDADYDAQIGLGTPRNTFHHTSLLFSLEVLGDMLDFTLSFIWDHNTNPQAAEDGTIPKRDDLRTSFGIGVDI